MDNNEEPQPTISPQSDEPSDSPPPKADPQQEIAQFGREMSTFEKWTLGVAVIAAFFVCAQWWVMRGELKEMKADSQATNTLAEAAKKQADKAETISSSLQKAVTDMDVANSNAKLSLNATIRQFQLEQRAWVGAVDLPRPKDLAAGKKPSLEAIVTNTGKTPALDVTDSISGHAFLRGQAFVPIKTQPTINSVLSVGVIQPGQQVSLWTSPTFQTLTKDKINGLRSEGTILYVYGEISYKDVFGKVHHTHFCGFLRPDLTGFNACQSYNDAN